ncbi:MAG: hypothetical protein D6696_20775 [Acidobacteria bacterium]|nr:MAG: hypothetical protein D6696_20775 [Acidobacteriota bacterium]
MKDDRAARLAASRRRFEAELADLRRAVEREVGRKVDLRLWLLPLAGLALGVSAGMGFLARRRRRLRAAETTGDERP